MSDNEFNADMDTDFNKSAAAIHWHSRHRNFSNANLSTFNIDDDADRGVTSFSAKMAVPSRVPRAEDNTGDRSSNKNPWVIQAFKSGLVSLLCASGNNRSHRNRVLSPTE